MPTRVSQSGKRYRGCVRRLADRPARGDRRCTSGTDCARGVLQVEPADIPATAPPSDRPTMLIKKPDDVRSSEITDEKHYVDRRKFIVAAGAVGVAAVGAAWAGGC